MHTLSRFLAEVIYYIPHVKQIDTNQCLTDTLNHCLTDALLIFN